MLYFFISLLFVSVVVGEIKTYKNLYPKSNFLLSKETISSYEVHPVSNDTNSINTNFTSADKYIYVLTVDGKLFVANTEFYSQHAIIDRLYHDDLALGGNVLVAGELSKYQDKWVWNDWSGHYRPDASSLFVLGKWLLDNFGEAGGNMFLRINYRHNCDIFFRGITIFCHNEFYQMTVNQFNQFSNSKWLRGSLFFSYRYTQIGIDQETSIWSLSV